MISTLQTTTNLTSTVGIVRVDVMHLGQQYQEKVAEVARLSCRRCPMHATVAKAMKVMDQLFVSGQEVTI